VFDQEDKKDRFSSKMKEKIAKKLKKNNAVNMCPRCGNRKFYLANKYYMMPTQGDFNDLTLGDTIPCAIVVCKKCGFVSLHSIGALGLMESARKYDESE